MRRNGRVDVNQQEIVAALKAVFASVQHLHNVGGGCSDLLVGYRNKNFLLEVKPNKKAKLRETQREWHNAWMGQVAVVTSPEEAIHVITEGEYPMKNEQLVLLDENKEKNDAAALEQYLESTTKKPEPVKKNNRFWYRKRGMYKRD